MNNCILLQELAKGQRIFIVDIGGSYQKLTNALGGQYLEINLSEASRINPFHLDNPKKAPTDQKLKTLVACVESMVADDETGRLAKIDRVLLEKEIVELYESSAKSGKVPVMSNLQSRLEASTEPSMQSLAKMFTHGREVVRTDVWSTAKGHSGLTAEFALSTLKAFPLIRIFSV